MPGADSAAPSMRPTFLSCILHAPAPLCARDDGRGGWSNPAVVADHAMPPALTFNPGAILAVLAYALLIGWLIWRWSRRSVDPPGVLAIKVVLSLGLGSLAIYVGVTMHPLVGIPAAAALAIVVGILWGDNVGNAIAKPLASLYDGGDEAPEPKPFYAIAHAHRKQARYAEAVGVITSQLEKFPGDLEGLLLLAEIRARDLHDWPAAAAAIDEIVGNTALPVAPRAKALQALADWHMDLGQDDAGARECLQRIQDLFPGTPEANDAAQRLAHVGDGAWRRELHAPGRLRVVKHDDRLGLRGEMPPPPPEQPPAETARALLDQLAAHPLDAEARETLARLYADRLGRLDLALAELETLVVQPNQPARSVARCLHLMADLQIRCAGNEAAARTALERVGALYPESALAASAQARLDHLKLELRALQPAPRLVAGGPSGNATSD